MCCVPVVKISSHGCGKKIGRSVPLTPPCQHLTRKILLELYETLFYGLQKGSNGAIHLAKRGQTTEKHAELRVGKGVRRDRRTERPGRGRLGRFCVVKG